MSAPQPPRPNHSENLSARIYGVVRQKLILGELSPGAQLSIRTVAEEFSVSAMPVREALRQLASEEALIGAAKKAYRVPDLSPGQASELFYVRSVLEGAASELAVKSIAPKDIEDLEALATETDLAWQNGNPRRYLVANYRFHTQINQLADNSALQKMITDLYARTGPWLFHGVTNLITVDQLSDGHTKIVAALKSRNAKQVRELVEEDAQWAISHYQQMQ